MFQHGFIHRRRVVSDSFHSYTSSSSWRRISGLVPVNDKINEWRGKWTYDVWTQLVDDGERNIFLVKSPLESVVLVLLDRHSIVLEQIRVQEALQVVVSLLDRHPCPLHTIEHVVRSVPGDVLDGFEHVAILHLNTDFVVVVFDGSVFCRLIFLQLSCRWPSVFDEVSPFILFCFLLFIHLFYVLLQLVFVNVLFLNLLFLFFRKWWFGWWNNSSFISSESFLDPAENGSVGCHGKGCLLLHSILEHAFLQERSPYQIVHF